MAAGEQEVDDLPAELAGDAEVARARAALEAIAFQSAELLAATVADPLARYRELAGLQEDLPWARDFAPTFVRTRDGKLEIVATKPMATQRDLALAYSPGVAVPVRVIAENHGGHARIDETPGGGATFVMDLPLVAPGQAVELFFDAVPDATVTGKVARIVPVRAGSVSVQMWLR